MDKAAKRSLYGREADRLLGLARECSNVGERSMIGLTKIGAGGRE